MDDATNPCTYDYCYPYYSHLAPYRYSFSDQSPSCDVTNGGFSDRAVNLAASDVDATDEESEAVEGSEGLTRRSATSSMHNTASRMPSDSPSARVRYSYMVKIIPPSNKRRASVHELYDVETAFGSVDALRAQLKASFGDKFLPSAMQFQVGYFEGRGSAKRWISSGRDLNKMYSQFEPGSRITLWCDGIDDKEKQPPTKK